MNVNLNFTDPIFENQFELLQNQPNPFYDRTVIGFYLPDNAKVTLTLRDETSRDSLNWLTMVAIKTKVVVIFVTIVN